MAVQTYAVRLNETAVGGFVHGIEQELRQDEKLGFRHGGVGPSLASVGIVRDVRYGLVVRIVGRTKGGADPAGASISQMNEVG